MTSLDLALLYLLAAVMAVVVFRLLKLPAMLGYLVAGLSLPAMTLGGLAAGLLVALGAGAIARLTLLREDSSLAAFYLLSLAAGVVLVPSPARAAEDPAAYPSRPITIVVGFTPGGPTDIFGRMFAQRLSTMWAQDTG